MRASALIVASILGFFPSLASAGVPNLDALIKKGGQAVLEYSDEAANPYPDRTFTVQMLLEGGNDDGRKLKMMLISKQGTKTALRFQEPADLKGLALVIKGGAEIYVKLPRNQKCL